ncbi:MAG: flagellar hook-length control protein FliK [Polyangiaceae bacterium]
MSDNVSGAGTLPSYDKLEKPERDELDDERRTAWALVLADAVVHRLPRLELELGAPSADAGTSEPPASEAALSATPGELETELDGGSAARGQSRVGGAGGAAPIEHMSVSVDDERLGKVAFTVTRDGSGLDIVIAVADSHVKALIEAERIALVQALKAAGLTVVRVEVAASQPAGTLLAPNPRGARSSSGSRGQSAKVRAYRTSLEEEATSTAENVDLTA